MSDIITKYHHDWKTDALHIERVQDCEPIVEEVAKLKQVTDGRGDTSLGYHMGRIPGVIVEQYLIEVGINFEEFIRDDIHVKRILNDPTYKKFRIFEGRM